MIIVNKKTLELTTPEEMSSDINLRHIIFNFSEDGLEGSDYAIVKMPDQPMFDSSYQKANAVNVVESNGVYSATWELSILNKSISEFAEIKIKEIEENFEKESNKGFYSSALGDPNFYAYDQSAKTNIQANLLKALSGKAVRHICTDQQGVTGIKEHTIEQMEKVGEDLELYIWSNLEKQAHLKNAVSETLENNNINDLILIKWY